MPNTTNRSIQEQHEEFARRRKELVLRARQTIDLSELSEIAQQFGELCDEEDALLRCFAQQVEILVATHTNLLIS